MTDESNHNKTSDSGDETDEEIAELNYPDEMDYDGELLEENPGDCGEFGEVFPEPGTEECDCCPMYDECMKTYRDWLRRTKGGTRPP